MKSKYVYLEITGFNNYLIDIVHGFVGGAREPPLRSFYKTKIFEV